MIEAFDEVYCYPNSNVLKNLYGFRNQERLTNFERDMTFKCIADLADKPCRGNLDYQHLKDIHKFLFSKIYTWAGEERTVEIAKSNFFCRTLFISDMAEDIFSKLAADNYLIGKREDDVIKGLAYYLGEINALHPFREGNGRSQREFIRCTAAIAGYKLNFMQMENDKYINACISSFMGNYEELEQIIKENTIKMSYRDQFVEMKKIAKPGTNLSKVCQNYREKIKRISQDLSKQGYLPTDKVLYEMERLSESALKYELPHNNGVVKLKDISQLKGKDPNIDIIISSLRKNLKKDPLQDLAP